jgi:hypothetical protein
MCTLSIISTAQAGFGPRCLRVVFSRDEQRDRPAALAPRWRSLSQARHGATRAIWPTDPRGGGTWIAAADSGLILCLLNLNLEPPPVLPGALLSRGQIIPRLIGDDKAGAAIAGLEQLDLDRFPPFRLVAIDAGTKSLLVARWDRTSLTVSQRVETPVCLVSSGLGDTKVQGRLEVFEEMVVQGGLTPESQDRFHLHIWPHHPELSVLMSRPDARTVSITTADVSARENGTVDLRMAHQPVVEGHPGDKAMKARPMALLGHGC